jgi:diguanylate cyclase (GGDEF)-like protein/PAS domain S-box-containing protein
LSVSWQKPQNDALTVTDKVKAGFGVAFVLRLGAGIALLMLAVQWEQNSRSVAHINEVIQSVEQLSLDVTAEEASARRYIETRNRLDLARWRDELNRAQKGGAQIQSLVADMPELRDNVARIRSLIGRQSDRIQRSFATGAASSADPAGVRDALASLDRDGSDSDIRAAILGMQSQERQLLRADITWQQRTAALSRITSVMASACSLSLILFAGWRISTDRKKRDAVERKLRIKEEQYRNVVELAGDFIYRTDEEGRFTFCNQAALTSLHFSKPEVIGRSYLKLVRQDKRRAAERFYARQFVRRRKNTYYECPIVDGHGRERWVGLNVQLVMDEGKIVGFQAIARDITERKYTEFELQKSRHFVERIAATTPGILYVYDLVERRTVYNNREVATILGYKPEEFGSIESIDRMLVHPDDLTLVRSHHEALRHAQDGEVRRVEYRARHADGRWIWLAARDTAFERGPDGLVKQMVGIAQDITAPKAIQDKLAYQANYDSLTGLSNRHHFYTGLQSVLRRASIEMAPTAICLFDVDHFKAINDRFGHAAGDEVLEAIGGIVRTELRATDLGGRLGGDEFCFALPGTDTGECTRVAERIRERLGTLAFGMGSGSAFSVTATFGVAETEHDADAKELMEAADRALYRAKAAGRNRVIAAA